MSENNSILEKVSNALVKGSYFEELVKCVLEDLGFEHIRKQHSGSQYGFDVEGCMGGSKGELKVWKFEAKNLKKVTGLNDIAPKLLSHQRWNELYRFVIVSRKPISNDLHHLLEGHGFPFDIDVWDMEKLSNLITSCPTAIRYLGLDFNTKPQNAERLETVRYPKKKATFHLIHEHHPRPFSYDYMKKGNSILKCFTEHEFRLFGACFNHLDKPITINQILVRTEFYERVTGRVLRQHKLKGLFEPIDLSFKPIPKTGEVTNVLPFDKWLKIESGSEEVYRLILAPNAHSGHYELSFTMKGFYNGAPISFQSFVFPLNIKDKESDHITLGVLGKHYDSVAKSILELDSALWGQLRDLSEKSDDLISLENICCSQLEIPISEPRYSPFDNLRLG